MDPLEAILAKMAKATGNAPMAMPTEQDSDIKSAVSIKRERPDDEESKTTAISGIWNPNVMQELDYETPTKGPLVTPSMEIARQQIVRQLCNKIRRVSEEMGIAKLPNSTYETWQFTSKLTVSEVRYSVTESP